MFRSIVDLFKILTREQKIRVLKLQLLIITMAFLELLGIGGIAPFMSLVGDENILYSDSFLADFYEWSKMTEPNDFVVFVGICLLLLLTLSTIFSVMTTWKLSRFAYDTGTEIADRLFIYYISKNWMFHLNNNSAFLIKQIAGDSQRVTNNVLQPLLQLNAKIVLATVICVALVIYSWQVAFGGVVIFCVAYFLLFKIVRNRLDKNGRLISDLTQTRYQIMSESFGGIKELLVLNRRANAAKKFEKSGKELAACQGVNTAIGTTPRYVMELIAFGSIVSLLLFLYITHNGNIGQILPLLSLCALAGFKLLPAFQTIYTSIAQIRGNISAFESIREDMQLSIDSNNFEKSKESKSNQIGDINLVNISFKFPGANKNSLEDINLNITPNTTVAFVGSSGAGKSTLIDIVLGLLKPDSGKIIFDKTIEKKSPPNWNGKIGYVPQSIYLSEGSIAENIAFGLPVESIDLEKIKKSLIKSELYSFVMNLDQGIETNIGEHGLKLSGGQRQRIGIARALYHDPNILVFDEATSALDGLTENSIMKAINQLGNEKTIIMIAHRLKTIQAADVIYFLNDGKITDFGRYQDLIEKNEEFRAMAMHS